MPKQEQIAHFKLKINKSIRNNRIQLFILLLNSKNGDALLILRERQMRT